MTDIFHQNAFAEVNKEGGKLRTYAHLKTEIGREGYLDLIDNFNRRKALTKIRLSNHRLMIEKGRHEGLEEGDRVCPFCTNMVIENEAHFILDCPTYNVLREELLEGIQLTFPTFSQLPHIDQMRIILSHDETANSSSIFLQKGLDLREFLVGKPKNNM